MRLSKNFHLDEFTRSETAARHRIPNNPSLKQVANIKRVAHTLELVRLIVESPIYVTSGYRSDALNEKVRGSRNSAHIEGLAADFVVKDMKPKDVVEAIRDQVGFDQLILEFDRWIHIGLSDKHRQQVLRASNHLGPTEYSFI